LRDNPNIILIVMDAVRADRLSCYGYRAPTTPGLEEIAAEALIFERAFAAAPWTPPSHASLFTGTYPSRHGVDVGENLYLSSVYPTMAEILSRKGYATMAILPDAHLSAARGFSRGFTDFVETFRLPYVAFDYDSATSLLRNLALGRDARAYHSSRLLKKWLHKQVRSETQPFFAFINYKTAHNSYRSPLPFRSRFNIAPLAGQDPRKLRYYANGGAYPYMAGGLDMSERDMQVVGSWYDGAIAYLDHSIRDLLQYLRELGVYDDTLIVITADHGENFGDHGLGYHLFCLYDSLIRVPLLMSYPRLGESGKRINSLVSLTDVLPTILELIGCDLDDYPALQGKSLLPFDGSEVHGHIFAEFGRPQYMLKRLAARYPEHSFSRYDKGLQCIRTTELKLIAGTDGSEELYRLNSDPAETRNVIEDYPAEANILRRALRERFAPTQPATIAVPTREDDRVITKNLEDLGYF
jgi:arylsulfatase A-like enzyme